jgi:hypothetical protein
MPPHGNRRARQPRRSRCRLALYNQRPRPVHTRAGFLEKLMSAAPSNTRVLQRLRRIESSNLASRRAAAMHAAGR